MIPETLQTYPVVSAVDQFRPDAVLDGKLGPGGPTLEIAREHIAAVCRFLKQEQTYVRLSTITAVDRYPSDPRFEVIYHVHSLERNERLRLKCRVSDDRPTIDSVTSVWQAANWYEREVFDLFGIYFNEHPNLRRIMLPNDWEGHPLRKDYPITGARV